ncbi:MAG: hypothetical protein KDA05_12325 [Phycisphaerales bacterium]|nr:hypothetical protein [Phycisphaerales bacterium]
MSRPFTLHPEHRKRSTTDREPMRFLVVGDRGPIGYVSRKGRDRTWAYARLGNVPDERRSQTGLDTPLDAAQAMFDAATQWPASD